MKKLAGSVMLASFAAAGAPPAAAGMQSQQAWFKPCAEAAAASEGARRWLERHEAIEADRCFLADGNTFLILTGSTSRLIAVDLDRPEAQPHELLSLGEGDVEEFVGVNGMRFAVLRAADRQGDRTSYADYLLFLPRRPVGLPVRLVELWSSVYLGSSHDARQRQESTSARALHRLRGSPSTFIELEVGDEDLSLSLEPLRRQDGKVEGLALRTQFDGIALRYLLKPAFFGLEPTGFQQFVRDLRRRLPKAIVRTGVSDTSPPRVFRKTMAKAKSAEFAHRLEDIPNIGKSVASDLRLIGIHAPVDVKKMDPHGAYDRLCEASGVRHDPCVIDTFVAAHDFMNGGAARPWWEFTPLRKSRMSKERRK